MTIQHPKEIESSFVVVEKAELPTHDSKDVQEILPNENSFRQQTESFSTKDTEAINIESKDILHNSIQESASEPTKNLKTSCLETMEFDPSDPLFSRKFICSPHLCSEIPENSDRQFSIASYNILADCHALRYGQYPWSTDESLSIAQRHIRLHKEFKYLDTDILCLQEVSPSYFHDVLLPTLRQHGYEGIFIKRVAEDHEEGEASFYRTSRFTLLNSQGLVLHKLAQKELNSLDVSDQTREMILGRLHGPGVLLTMQLQCKNTGSVVTVGNIHVDWGEFKMPDRQCVQIACAIKEIVSQAGGADKPHIICGDFNSVPSSPGYVVARDGYLTDQTLAVLQSIKVIEVPGREEKSAVVDIWWKGFQHPSSTLKSSYFTVQGSEPWSSRFPHDGVVRNVDFIWFSSGSMELRGVLELVPSNLIEKGIPDDVVPSDHLSTKAVFTIK